MFIRGLPYFPTGKLSQIGQFLNSWTSKQLTASTATNSGVFTKMTNATDGDLAVVVPTPPKAGTLLLWFGCTAWNNNAGQGTYFQLQNSSGTNISATPASGGWFEIAHPTNVANGVVGLGLVIVSISVGDTYTMYWKTSGGTSTIDPTNAGNPQWAMLQAYVYLT